MEKQELHEGAWIDVGGRLKMLLGNFAPLVCESVGLGAMQ